MSVQEKFLVSKLLIVGGGMTGSVTASLINDEAFADIEIWEKQERTGGRFYTYRHPDNPNCAFDAGAQYISITLELFRSLAKVYNELLDEDLLLPLSRKLVNFRKLSDTKLNFVTPDGIDTLVTNFLKKSGAKVKLEHEVKQINLNVAEKKWEVKAQNGDVKLFDVVILAIPAPEILKIEGDFLNLTEDDDVRLYLEQVKYCPRLSAGFIYDKAMQLFEDFPKPVKYYPEDDIIHLLSVDNRKRGKDSDCPVLLAQTTKQFAAEHLEKSSEEIEDTIYKHLKSILPDLPKPSSVKIVKWPYAQVEDTYIDSPGCIVLSKHPMLLCGGDSFTETHFNGCVKSAMRIVEELLKTVQFSKQQRKKSSAV